MVQSFIPVILAGGKGERFWPLSRRHHPKQFLSLDNSGDSLLQSTANRLLPIAKNWNNLWLVTTASIIKNVKKHLPHLVDSNILIEPEGKDTAPAVAWATLEIVKRYGNDVIIGFFPADHWIKNEEDFLITLDSAFQLASPGNAIVTLGVQPTYPSTGYGYIEQGKLINYIGNLPAYQVNRFMEKPSQKTAELLIANGKYSWNSGILIFRANIMLQELEKYTPQLLNSLRKKGKDAYKDFEKISIDYALMEKTQFTYILSANFGWDDLGDWNSLERLTDKTTTNIEHCNHIGLDTTGSIIYASEKNELIATIGIENLVIVRDKNVTLIVDKNRTQDIKQILKQIANCPESQDFL